MLHDQTLTADGNSNPSLLDNDTDADGDPLSVASVNGSAADVGQTLTLASGAQLTVQADGTFTYVAAAGYIGNDSFTYTASDGALTTNSATVTIAVTNQAPVAQDAVYTTTQNEAIFAQGADANPSLLANDTDVDGDPLCVVSINDSAANVGKQITLGSGSRLTVQADGSFLYIPATDFVGADTFTYSVGDGAAIASATVQLTVSAGGPGSGISTGGSDTTDDDNVLTANDDAYTGLHDQTMIVDAGPGSNSLLANDIQTIPTTLNVAAVNGLAANVGAFVTLASGASLLVEPDGSFTYIPLAGYVGTDQFTYTASDGTNTSNTANVIISLTNHPPVAGDASYSVLHDQTLSVDDADIPSLLTNDINADNDPLTIAAVNGSASSVGQTITLASGRN